jgi:DNA-binding MarR family transcriptional regulator
VTVEQTVRDAGRAAARLSKALELAVGEVSLSLPQYRLLAFLSGGPERATELASWLEVSPPSLTALVDGLVQKGLVERVTSEEDRRCVRHVLTAGGAASLITGDSAIAQRLTVLLDYLAPDEARSVHSGLGYLALAMDRFRDAQKKAEEAAKVASKKEVIPT